MSYPTIEIIGGGGGSPFSFTGQDNGASLENIWVWVGGWQVKAVKVQLSDGRCETFGQPYGSCAEYKFRPGECISSLSLWGNGAGSRLGAIKFSTNRGGNFFAHMTSWGLKTEYPIDVGSGYCLGVMGRCGQDVDSMGFMFISPVQSAVLTDVEYPTLKLMKPQVTVEELKSITYQNDSSAIQHQTIHTEKKVRKESSWSKNTSITAAFDFEVKAGIPKLADVSAEFHFSVGTTSTYSQEQIDERNETLSFPLQIPPGKKVDVIITIGKAVFDLPYTGKLKITCKNGSVLQYNIKGKYNGITYTDIKVDTKESDL